MSRLVKAELRRLFATRIWQVGLLCAVVCGGGLVGLLTLLGPENFQPPMPGVDTETGVRTILGMVGFTVFVPGVLGTLAVPSEYRHRTVTYTFLFAPRRWHVLTAKLVTYAAAGLTYGVVLTGSAGAALYAGAAVHGLTPGPSTGTILELLSRLALTMAVYVLIGAGVGALVRNQVAALLVVVGYLYMGETLLSMIPWVNQLYPLLPGGATAALNGFTYVTDTMATELGTTSIGLLSPMGGGLLLAGYAVAAAALAVAVPMRRDVQ